MLTIQKPVNFKSVFLVSGPCPDPVNLMAVLPWYFERGMICICF